MTSNNTFIVYEHWRPDINRCFYVGASAYDYRRERNMTSRSVAHLRVQEELRKSGHQVSVRVIYRNFSFEDAQKAEAIRIRCYLEQGHPIVNKKHIKDNRLGYLYTKAQRKKISVAKTGSTLSEEHKQKTRLGNIGKRHTDEARFRISESHRGEKNPMFGRKFSSDHKMKLSIANRGKKRSEESIAKFAEAHAKNRSRAMYIAWYASNARHQNYWGA